MAKFKSDWKLHKVAAPCRGQSGVAAIELALVLGVMVIVIGGSIAYGLMFLEEQTLVEAIHTGTRAAALNPAGTPPDVLTARIKNSVTAFIQQTGSDPSRYALKITPFQVPLTETTNSPAVRLSLTRKNRNWAIFGQSYVSTGCFGGSTTIEKSNTADSFTDEGGADC